MQRWHAAWMRLVNRLPLSEHRLEPEMPADAYGVTVSAPRSVKSPGPPPASVQPEYR